jgi:hypothetical protein
VQLQDVTVLQDVVATDLLSAEMVVAPDAGVA